MTNTMKKLTSLMMAGTLLAGCSSAPASSNQAAQESAPKEKVTIGVAQIVDHPSLNTIRDAIIDELEVQGYKDGETAVIKYQNAANQISNLDTIMSGYASDKADIIIAIATPTAQSAQNFSDKVPVIFSAVSDPVGAGLVKSLNKPGGNVTGTSDEVQVDQICDLIGELTPSAKTVGVLYNAGEANSVSNVKKFKEYAASKGLKVVEKTGTDLTTLQQAASVLCQDVDVLFSPNDNTVASGMAALSQIALKAKVPYYVGADSMVKDGGFATVGIDYEALGRETALMAVNVLNGNDPAEMPVKVFKDDLNVYINQNDFDQLSKSSKVPVQIPDSVKNSDKLVMVK